MLGSIGAILALASLAAIILFPLRDLPAPTGPYPVGTASFVVTDDSRTGVYLDGPGQPRRIMAQAWYPAAAEAAAYPRARWIPDEPVATAYAEYANLPAFAMSHLRLIGTNGRLGAPAADGAGTMPVVILSHGWTGTRAMHVDLAEELASRGVVAIAVDHPYGALSVSFPDGSVAPLYRGALPKRSEGEEAFDEAASYLVSTYAADIAAVAARARSGDTVPALAGRLDASRLALVGHSTGGGAAVLAAMADPAVAGVVGLDAWVEPLGDSIDAGLAAPQLHVGSASWEGGPNAERLERLRAASGPWEGYRVTDSGHADFAMIRHVTSAGALMGLAGRLDGFRFARVVTPLVCDWLQALLEAGPSSSPASERPLPVDEALRRE